MLLENCIAKFIPDLDTVKIKNLLENKKIASLAQEWILNAKFFSSPIFYNAYLKNYINGTVDICAMSIINKLSVDPNVEKELGNNRKEYLNILLSEHADSWMEEYQDRFGNMTADDLYEYIDHMSTLERIYKAFKYFEDNLTNNNIEASDVPEVFTTESIVTNLAFLYMLAYVKYTTNH